MDALLRVNEVFRDVFEADDLSITRDTTAADVDGWDSLMHVRLVMAIEKEFGARFTSSEVSSLTNVGDLLDVLERKAAARAGV